MLCVYTQDNFLRVQRNLLDALAICLCTVATGILL